MKSKLSKAILCLICFIVLSGCTQKQLLSEEEIHIGVIGDIKQFEYSNVLYEPIEVEELLINDKLNTQFDFLMINDEHFNTVSDSVYVERFDTLQMPVIFVDSIKGWMPFISPITLQMPKLYKDYNDEPIKQSIVSSYELPGAFIGKSVTYSTDETLSKENFETLVAYIFR